MLLGSNKFDRPFNKGSKAMRLPEIFGISGQSKVKSRRFLTVEVVKNSKLRPKV